MTAPFDYPKISTLTAVMGLDPGVNGGVAVLRSDGAILYVRGFNTAETEDELSMILRDAAGALKSQPVSRCCYIEKVGAVPQDKRSLARLATFMRNYGYVRGDLRARGVSLLNVYPAMWQAKMECLTGGNKNISKRKAVSLFASRAPSLKITHAIADALLIAEYGRLQGA